MTLAPPRSIVPSAGPADSPRSVLGRLAGFVLKGFGQSDKRAMVIDLRVVDQDAKRAAEGRHSPASPLGRRHGFTMKRAGERPVTPREVHAVLAAARRTWARRGGALPGAGGESACGGGA